MVERPLAILFQPHGIPSDAFIASNATVLGNVLMGGGSSIWFGAVVRGDTAAIEIGSATNIQDLCVIHADPGFPCRLGDRVTLGHGAIVHGATIADDVMIGIRAVVLNGAKIGARSLIAACALVPEGMVVPPDSVVMGVPGRVVRQTTPEDLQRIEHAAQHYARASKLYRDAESKVTEGARS